MGTGQREGMPLLIFGVSTLAQSIGLAQEFTSSTAKIVHVEHSRGQTHFRSSCQEPIVARKFLDAEVMAQKTYHRGK